MLHFNEIMMMSALY